MKKCAIVINDNNRLVNKKYDTYIGVEKGANYLENLSNKAAKYFIGDFDSVSKAQKSKLEKGGDNVILMDHNLKSFVDGEEAIIYAIKKLKYKPEEIDVYLDFNNGRKDHSINMIRVAKKYMINIYGNNLNIISIKKNEKTTIKKENYKYISFFLFQKTKLKTTGLKWNIDNESYDIKTGTTLVSNEILSSSCAILSDKDIIIMQTND